MHKICIDILHSACMFNINIGKTINIHTEFLFCICKWLDIKASVVHHPVIQKQVEELLAKGAFKPSTSGADFYSNII